MPKKSFRIEEIAGLRSSDRRAVVFLVGDECNGKPKFDALASGKDRVVRARMDHWISGAVKDEYFHGWPQSAEYRSCFCFKWKENKVHQRLYGFLCHPDHGNPRFQVCVLVTHDAKTTAESDKTILTAAARFCSDGEILEQVRQWLRQRASAGR